MPKPVKRQRWSNIDVFGLLNGISTWDPQYRTLLYVRTPTDSTLDVRAKIFRNNNNPPSLTKQGLLNGIGNEFGYDPYNVSPTSVFQLTNSPFPSGDIGTQDIWVEYRDINTTGTWTSLYPQVWGQTYQENKDAKKGFIVWQNEKYINISGVKNFTYSTILEVMEDLPDNQELRISYWVNGIDEDNNLVLKRFTDVDNLEDPYNRYYVYRKPVEIDVTSGITVYTLNDIPTGLYLRYYDSFKFPLEQLYTIKEHINSKYRHTWGTMGDATVIWDVHKQYGSGNIPHFFDVAAPQNELYCLQFAKESGYYYSGLLGGIEDLSHSLYLDQILESGEAYNWYFTLYPGKFYLDGIPFYMFESPGIANITFVGGQADIPSGLQRGAHAILAKSGYFESACTGLDEYLSGYIFEDHTYPVGEGGDTTWSYIYRRRGFVPSGIGYNNTLLIGEYNIDFENNKINAALLDTDATIIWEKALIPSGRLIEYDLNPLNNNIFSQQKFFLYLGTKEN